MSMTASSNTLQSIQTVQSKITHKDTPEQCQYARELLAQLERTRLAAEQTARLEIDATRRLEAELAQSLQEQFAGETEKREQIQRQLETLTVEWQENSQRWEKQFQENSQKEVEALSSQSDAREQMHEIERHLQQQEQLLQRNEEMTEEMHRQTEEKLKLRDEAQREHERFTSVRLDTTERDRLQESFNSAQKTFQMAQQQHVQHEQRLHDYERKRQPLEQNLTDLQNEIQQEERAFQSAQRQLEEGQPKKDEHEQRLHHAQESVRKLQQETNKARKQQQESRRLMNEAEKEVEKHVQYVENIEQKKQQLDEQFQSVQRQIDQLIRQRQQIETEMTEMDNERKETVHQLQSAESTLSTVKNDQQRSDELLDRALQLETQARDSLHQIRQQNELFDRESWKPLQEQVTLHRSRLYDCRDQLNRIRSQLAGIKFTSTTESLPELGVLEQQLEEARRALMHFTRTRTPTSPESMQRQRHVTSASLRLAEREAREAVEKERQARQDLAQFKKQHQRLREQFKQAQHLENLAQQHLIRLRQQMDHSQQVFSASREKYEMEMDRLTKSLHDCQEQMEQRRLHYQTNLPQDPRLIAQWQREAEAILRAETARALELRQRRVVDETEQLAQVKVKQLPRLEMDATARQNLFDVHWRDRSVEEESQQKVANLVMEMVAQNHIR